MKRLLELGKLTRIVEGDPNEIEPNEILVIKDKETGLIEDIKVRGKNGKLKSVLRCKEIQ